MQRLKPKLVVVGWRDADWPFLQPLLDAGALPNLTHIVQSGATATLAAPEPLVEVAHWTTLATGMRSDRHGVNHTTEIRPDLGGVQPIGRRSWAVPAFWEWAEAAGLRTACINWPATSPATRWPGVHVDELFKVASGRDAAAWPIPRHAVSPASLKPALRQQRVHPAEDLTLRIAALLPPAGVLDAVFQSSDSLARRLLAGVMTVHETSLALAERANWDVLCLCADALIVRRTRPDSKAGGGDAAGRAAAILADLMLGQLLSFVPRQASVFVVSPSGMDHSSGSFRRRPNGMLACVGPDITPGALHAPGQAISLLDLAPSLLARLNIRYACDGRINPVLAGPNHHAAESAPAPGWVPPGAAPFPPEADQATSQQQVDAMRRSSAAAGLNKARALLARGSVIEAAQALRDADRLWPNNPPILKLRVQCLLRLSRHDQALPIAQALVGLDPDDHDGRSILAACRTRMNAPA